MLRIPPTRISPNEVLPFPEFLQISSWRVVKVRFERNVMGWDGWKEWATGFGYTECLKRIPWDFFQNLEFSKRWVFLVQDWFQNLEFSKDEFVLFRMICFRLFRPSVVFFLAICTSEDNAFEACCRQHMHAPVSALGSDFVWWLFKGLKFNQTIFAKSCFIRV